VQTQVYASTSSAGVAVDASGNIYISDLGLGEVLRETPQSGGGYLKTIVASGLCDPAGVAVDASGNIYIADNCENEVLQETPQSGGSYAQTVIAAGLNTPVGVAVDSNDNIYVVDGLNHQVVELLPGGADFGAVQVGSTSPVISLHFTVDSIDQTTWNLLLKSKQVRTQGAVGLDFTDTGTGTCNTSTPLYIGGVCTVNISFTPQRPGARNGSAALTNAAGVEIATGYIKGTGVGPQISFAPPTQALLFNPVKTPAGISADGGGNVYVADTGNNRILKATLSGGYAPTTVPSSALSSPASVAVDGNGNVYVANTGNNRILKETLQFDGSWAESTLASGLNSPTSVAVDGAGNVYIADTGNNRVLKQTLTLGKYSQSAIGSGLIHPVSVAADGSGNIYILDGGTTSAGDSPAVYEETALSGGGYTQSLVATSTLANPQALAVDSMGNLYVTDLGTTSYRILKETLTSGSFTESVLPFSGLTSPWGVAVDASGNVYVADSASATVGVYKLTNSTPPALNFAHPTDMGSSDSTDGEQTATLANIGNATLTLPIPSTGNDPSISANYSLDSSSAKSCPVVTSGASSAATLAAESTCTLTVNFLPTTYGSIAGSLQLTDNNLNAAAASYATQKISLSGSGVAPTQLQFSAPPTITLGQTLLLDAQAIFADGQTLDIPSLLTWTSGNSTVANFITSGVPSYVTSLAPGTTNITVSLGASTTPASVTRLLTVNRLPAPTLSASFTPNLIALNGSGTTTLTVTINNPNTLALTGLSLSNSYPATLVADATPGNTCGGSLSSTASGFSLAGGATLAAGASCTISVAMHGTTAGNYTDTTGTATSNEALLSTSASASVTVGTIAPTLSLSCPSNQPFDGNAHSCTGVATGIGGAAVAGSWSYSPASEINAGNYPVSGTFTSSNGNYTNGTASGTLTIIVATPTLSLNCPKTTYDGNAHSCTGVATGVGGAAVAGSWSIVPASQTTAGSTTVNGTFTSGNGNYASGSASGTLTISQAAPTISWATPAAITYPTALGATQLNATASVPGNIVYSPASGTVLKAGAGQTLSANFTPTDVVDYSKASQTVLITVNQAQPALSWAQPAAISYGTTLAGVLNAALNSTWTGVAGSISYTATPSAGGNATSVSATTVLGAGSHTLAATFAPTDTIDYKTATIGVALLVNQSVPGITWASPAAISYGTALGTPQLNATASFNGTTVAGNFVYTPASGTVLKVGAGQTLSVVFTPSDTVDYTTATKSVTINITQATPTIGWATPAAITYGTVLGAMQLNAAATFNGTTVTGSFVYTPASGTVLNAGTGQTLSVVFTPNDTADYGTASGSVLLTVNPATQSIAFTNSNAGYSNGVPSGPNTITMTATYGAPPLTLSALGGASGNPVTFALASGPATLNGTTLTVTGAGTVTVTANQAGNSNYSAAPLTTEIIVVAKATPLVSLATNPLTSFLHNPVQLTATVGSSVSQPSGTATFFDGVTPIGTVNLTGGLANLSTNSLTAGSHTITVVYSGDANFAAPNSNLVAVYVEDFTISYNGSSSTTVMPGSTTEFNFTVSPPSGTTFPATIALTISGLPTGSTYSFSPTTLASGAGSTNLTLTVQLPQTMISAHSNNKLGRSLAPLALAFLLLPFGRRLRRARRLLRRRLALLLLLAASLTATAGLSGCGSPNPFYAQGGGSYEVMVTATSGALSHYATAILNIE